MSQEEVFRTRLRHVRNKKGVSQRQAAEVLGITKISYQNYEAGRRKPSFDMLPSIADFFGVSLDYLFGRSDNPVMNH